MLVLITQNKNTAYY